MLEFELCLRDARDALRKGDSTRAWARLERAHVLSQASAIAHVRVHLAMLVCGWQQRDLGEIWGQIGRLLLAAPASIFGVYPAGNIGRATVSAFEPVPISEDVRRLLSEDA